MLMAVIAPSAMAHLASSTRDANRVTRTAPTASSPALASLNAVTLAGKAGTKKEISARNAGYPGGKCVAAGIPGRFRKRKPWPVASERARMTYIASS